MNGRAWGLFAALLLAVCGPAHGVQQIDIERELDDLRALGLDEWTAGKTQPAIDIELERAAGGDASHLHLPEARFRIAVFEFEDPDGTGLGAALAGLIAREILLSSDLRSLGILRYRGSLQPSERHPQSYFDKVDLVTDAQQVSLAVWGLVRRREDRILVDVMAQLPERVVRDSFTWSLKLPRAIGGESLAARVWPTRVQVQQLVLPAGGAQEIQRMAEAIDIVRAGPDERAPAIAYLAQVPIYSVVEKREGWARFLVNGETGWVRRAARCEHACAPLLAAAGFVGDLLRFGQGGPAPKISSELSPDAAVLAKQLVVMSDLRAQRYRSAEHYRERWHETESGGTGGFGASYANLLALATLASKLHARAPEDYDRLRLSEKTLREASTSLALASQDDPHNLVVLRNLAVLFRALDDDRRAELATDIVADLERGAGARP